jgi:hypothetical protein
MGSSHSAESESTTAGIPAWDSLSDETILCILSFVSYAPYENVNDAKLIKKYNQTIIELNKQKLQNRNPKKSIQGALTSFLRSNPDKSRGTITEPNHFGTLTHVLPLVCKRIRNLCQILDLWYESLGRILRTENAWRRGLYNFVVDNIPSEDDLPGSEVHKDNVEEFISLAARYCGTSMNSVSGKDLFQAIRKNRPVVMPIFAMRMNVELSERIHLHFFEPRYRLLINEVMRGRPIDELNMSRPTSNPRPRFLLACAGNLKAAVVVEVEYCRIYVDGRADVVLVPISWEALPDAQIRGDSGNLWEASISRFPKRSRLPVFYTTSLSNLQDRVSFWAREAGHKSLITQAMKERTEGNGHLLQHPRPQFILAPNSCILEVERCHFRDDGSAEVDFLQKDDVVIESIFSRDEELGIVVVNVLHVAESVT